MAFSIHREGLNSSEIYDQGLEIKNLNEDAFNSVFLKVVANDLPKLARTNKTFLGAINSSPQLNELLLMVRFIKQLYANLPEETVDNKRKILLEIVNKFSSSILEIDLSKIKTQIIDAIKHLPLAFIDTLMDPSADTLSKSLRDSDVIKDIVRLAKIEKLWDRHNSVIYDPNEDPAMPNNKVDIGLMLAQLGAFNKAVLTGYQNWNDEDGDKCLRGVAKILVSAKGYQGAIEFAETLQYEDPKARFIPFIQEHLSTIPE